VVSHKSWYAWPARVAALALVTGLFGCAIIDKYATRAVDYNLEAEQAQQQALLLNIIRASLRRPMQFTSLQSITGNATVTGAVAGGYVNTHNTPDFDRTGGIVTSANSALARIVAGNVSGAASMGGGATFTVPVLDTQEFYQGILTPIPLQSFDLFLQQGYPPELLFDLFVAKVVITRIDDGGCRQFTFLNSVGDDFRFGQFQAFADYLVGSGLTTERVTSISAFGPPIAQSKSRSASPADTAKVLDAYSKISSAGLDLRQVGSQYRVQKRTSQFRLCFANPGGAPPDWIGRPDSRIFCGQFHKAASKGPVRAVEGPECVQTARGTQRKTNASELRTRDFDTANQGVHANGMSEFSGFRLAPKFLDRIDRLQAQFPRDRSDDSVFRREEFAGGTISFIVYTRSTEGILYYLGEIARRRLFTETQYGEKARYIQVKTSIPRGTFPASECEDAENGGRYERKTDLQYLSIRRGLNDEPHSSYNCENIFVLDNQPSIEGHIISVSYDGMSFSVPRDRERSGRTTQVLELVKQLLALNTSAKQLPTTGVISVISQ
jgi:hypothetical protein